MRVKEGVMMNKKDWFYSGIIAISLLLLVISNIELIILMLSRSYGWAVLYGLGIAILLFILTKFSLTRWGYSVNKDNHWIKNHLIFWIMTDYHALIMIARYAFPKDRTNGFIPDLLLGIHLALIIPVYFLNRWPWYKKHEFLVNIILHLVTYTMLSYTFIQFVIQTMQ